MPRREIVDQRGTRRVSRHVGSSIAATNELCHRTRQDRNDTLLQSRSTAHAEQDHAAARAAARCSRVYLQPGADAEAVGARETAALRSASAARANGAEDAEDGDRADVLDAIELHVDINDAGHVVVVWADRDDGGVYANRYTPAAGWQSRDLLSETLGPGTPVVFDLALAASGSAICFFVDSTGPVLFDLNYRRYTPAGGWGALQSVEDAGRIGLANNSLQVAYNLSGQGIMAWQEAAQFPNEPGGAFVDYNFMELAPTLP